MLIFFRRRQKQLHEARTVFSDLVYKNLDWPEAIWEGWIAFEHQHGSVEELEACLDKVERAQTQVNMRRAKASKESSFIVVCTYWMRSSTGS